MPMVAMNKPKNPTIQPLSGSLGEVKLPQITTPKTASQKNSKDLKLSAKSPMMGVKKASMKSPMTEPRKDPVVAIPMAFPACPFRASGCPSTAVAALAGVPGIFNNMALRLPP